MYKYQEFYDFIFQEHGLVLTHSEMDEIIYEAVKASNNDDPILTPCNEYVEGINMNCARCNQPKYTHI